MTEEPKVLLRIVRGDATPEELAALTAVIAARAATAPEQKPRGLDAWVASGRVPGTRTRADW